MRNLRLPLSGLIGTTVALCQIAGLGAGLAKICFEAESARDLKTPMKFVKKTNNSWSGEGYLEIPDGVYPEGTPKEIAPNKGEATFTFTVTSPGSYTVWSRTWWKDGCGNSVFVQIDDQTAAKLGEDGTYKWWHWVNLKGARFKLSAGKHVFKFLGREDGIKLDQVFLTQDDEYVPEGIRPVTQKPA